MPAKNVFDDERQRALQSLERGTPPWILPRREFAIAVTERFFGDLMPARRRQLEHELYHLLWQVDDALTATREIIDPLRAVIRDLEYLTRALARKQPHGDRMIAGMSLSLIGGVVPQALRVSLPGYDADDLGALFTQARVAELNSRETASSNAVQIGNTGAMNGSLLLPRASMMLAAVAFSSSATDRPFAVTLPTREWPDYLVALGFAERCEIPGELPMSRVLALDVDDRHKLRLGADEALSLLRLRFGIRTPTDPLRINAACFVYEMPSSTLARGLCEMMAAFPTCADTAAYRMVIDHDGAEGLYDHCVRHLRQSFDADMGENEAAIFLRFAGLITLDPIEKDETRRFLRGTIAAHRQVALLTRARCRLETLLSSIDFSAQDESVVLPDRPATQVTWTDFHHLGRWCDDLRSRLATGSVDTGRTRKSRIRLPQASRRRFPSDVTATMIVDALVERLVRALRTEVPPVG